MSAISFETIVYEINSRKVIRFPKAASERLSSRGMVMIKGTLNGVNFEAPLEPDGAGSHWFQLDDTLSEEAHANTGDTVSLIIEPLTDWSEPDLPHDFKTALDSVDLMPLWHSLTTKARWEWVRWIRFTNNPQTRQKRIIIACDKLQSGKRRPCCFDLSRCTETTVSKNGVLLDPKER